MLDITKLHIGDPIPMRKEPLDPLGVIATKKQEWIERLNQSIRGSGKWYSLRVCCTDTLLLDGKALSEKTPFYFSTISDLAKMHSMAQNPFGLVAAQELREIPPTWNVIDHSHPVKQAFKRKECFWS